MKDKYLQQVQPLIRDHEDEIYRAHSQFTTQELVAIYTTALHKKDVLTGLVSFIVLRRRLQEEEPPNDFYHQQYAKVIEAFAYLYEYPYRAVLTLRIGDDILVHGAPAVKAYIDKWLDSPTALPYEQVPK